MKVYYNKRATTGSQVMIPRSSIPKGDKEMLGRKLLVGYKELARRASDMQLFPGPGEAYSTFNEVMDV